MLLPVTDLITGALTEIRVARGGDVVRAEDLALGVLFLNEVLERLAVTPHAIYAVTSVNAALVPGVYAYVLGPGGSFGTLPQRPVRVRRATLVLPGGASVIDIPSESVDWVQEHVTTSSAIPTGYWYNPTWPSGQLLFGPVPTMPYAVALELDVLISSVTESDTIDLPPGYSELLRLWTAKKAAPSFAREFSASSQAALSECLNDVFGTNILRVNDLDTRDGGVPGRSGGTYDYLTGEVS